MKHCSCQPGYSLSVRSWNFPGLVLTDDPIVSDNVFAVSPRTAAGTLLDGTMTLNGGAVPITRVRIQNSGATLIINDNSALSLTTYFGASGDGNDLTFHFQTLEGLRNFNSCR